MRESALFLLSLLVVVSVGVDRLYTRLHGFVCVRVYTDARQFRRTVECMTDRLKGVRWFHRGNTSADRSLFRFAIEKLRRYLATIRYCRPDRNAMQRPLNSNFNKKTFIGSESIICTYFVQTFFETADERDEERRDALQK